MLACVEEDSTVIIQMNQCYVRNSTPEFFFMNQILHKLEGWVGGREGLLYLCYSKTMTEASLCGFPISLSTGVLCS